MPTQTEQLLFRVAQEAVRNIVAHAAADRVTIHVAGDEGVATLRVVDDGRGFDADELERRRTEGHIGLAVLKGPRGVRGRHADSPVGPGCRDDDRPRGSGSVIRVAVIDDHTIVRNGLTQLIQSDPELVVIGTAPDGEAGVVLCVEHRPDVALMDLSMPGHRTGSRRLGRIVATEAPDVQVVVAHVVHGSPSRSLDALACGRRSATWLKDAEPEELLRGIHAAARGESPIDSRGGCVRCSALAAMRRDAPGRSQPSVSARCCPWSAEGLPNKQIARRLEISEKTVKAHLTSAFRAIGVDDRMQAGMWARRHGL